MDIGVMLRLDAVRTLKNTAVELGFAIMEHREKNAPQVILDELGEAFDHITSAVTILERSDE
tara:strand:- start:17 stop:202 length:186 start_codon:yes stop_codon:yes gene_type:complete